MPIEKLISPLLADVPGSIRPRYPFDEMDIGDWFVVPAERLSYSGVQQAVRRRNQAHPETKFSVEMVNRVGSPIAGYTCSAVKVLRVA